VVALYAARFKILVRGISAGASHLVARAALRFTLLLGNYDLDLP
jgi:hypothetical protein